MEDYLLPERGKRMERFKKKHLPDWPGITVQEIGSSSVFIELQPGDVTRYPLLFSHLPKHLNYGNAELVTLCRPSLKGMWWPSHALSIESVPQYIVEKMGVPIWTANVIELVIHYMYMSGHAFHR